MDPLALQRQLRNNSDDVMNFCEELKQWGEEMKRKDETLKDDHTTDTNLPKNKIRKTTDTSKVKSFKAKSKCKPIKGTDYSSWEKFDAEAECAKLDKDSKDYKSDELSDEYDENAQDEAIYEKEKGNKYVKLQKWDEAIQCYTNAIHRYGYDPIFYANRALCHLKKQNYYEAETDCTTALCLDKTYVKAYQRRAAAREALNQLTEAHNDLLKVFDYEPNNKESKAALMKLEKKLNAVNKEVSRKKPDMQQPKSKFTLSRQERKKLQSFTQMPSKSNTVTKSIKIAKELGGATYWPSGNDIEVVEPIIKHPHLQSKKPLRRVEVTNVDGIMSNAYDKTNKQMKNIENDIHPEAWPKPNENTNVIKIDEFKVVERKLEDYKKNERNVENNLKNDSKFKKERSNKIISDSNEFNLLAPETSVQFNTDWRLLQNKPEWKFYYLKQLNPKKFKNIFKESLDCDIFSGIIHTLADMFIEKGLPVYDYLLGLCEVKRFSMLTMFMSDEDKKDMHKLYEYMKSDSRLNKDEVENLKLKYGLK